MKRAYISNINHVMIRTHRGVESIERGISTKILRNLNEKPEVKFPSATPVFPVWMMFFLEILKLKVSPVEAF